MFGTGLWAMLVLISVIGGLRLLSWHRGKDLVSPRKELNNLRFALLMVSVMILFTYLNEPTHELRPMLADIEHVEDARKAIERQNEDLNEYIRESKDFGRSLYLTMLILLVGVLPALMKFSEAIVSDKSSHGNSDRENLISIFNNDKRT